MAGIGMAGTILSATVALGGPVRLRAARIWSRVTTDRVSVMACWRNAAYDGIGDASIVVERYRKEEKRGTRLFSKFEATIKWVCSIRVYSSERTHQIFMFADKEVCKRLVARLTRSSTFKYCFEWMYSVLSKLYCFQRREAGFYFVGLFLLCLFLVELNIVSIPYKDHKYRLPFRGEPRLIRLVRAVLNIISLLHDPGH